MKSLKRIVRLIALDLDGTLLDSKFNLSERSRLALTMAFDEGIEIAIVTGRRNSAARRLVKALHFSHYFITSAGALISSKKNGVISSSPFNSDLLHQFLIHVESFQGSTFLVTGTEGHGEILCHKPDTEDSHVARYLQMNREYTVYVGHLTENLWANVLQVVFMGSVKRMRDLTRVINDFSRISELSSVETRYPERDFSLVDAVRRDANKGYAVIKLGEMLAIDREEIIAIGDNYADESMLEVVGHPFVVANAQGPLRKRWPVIPSNDDDGVAKTIESHLHDLSLQKT